MRGEVIKCHTTISVSLQIYNSISTPFILSSVSLIDSLSSTCSVASPFFWGCECYCQSNSPVCHWNNCVSPPHFAAPRRRVQRVTPCLLQTLWPKVDNTSKHHQGDVLSPRRCLGGFQWWRVDENMFPCFVGKDKIVRTSRNGILTCLACSLIYIHLESIPFLLSLWMEGFNSWSHQWIGKEPCTEPLGIWYLWSHAIQQSAPFLFGVFRTKV